MTCFTVVFDLYNKKNVSVSLFLYFSYVCIRPQFRQCVTKFFE